MSLSTVPGMTVLGCSGILAVSELRSAILADFTSAGVPFLSERWHALHCLILFYVSYIRPRDFRDE